MGNVDQSLLRLRGRQTRQEMLFMNSTFLHKFHIKKFLNVSLNLKKNLKLFLAGMKIELLNKKEKTPWPWAALAAW